MPNKKTTKILRKAMTPGVIAAAGLAVTLSYIDTTEAISTRRNQLGIRAWENIGITGNGVVIGSLDGLPPLVDVQTGFVNLKGHNALASSNPVTVVFEEDGVLRRSFANYDRHSHQTATLGAMVATKIGSNSTSPIGIAPDAQALVGWFALDKDASGGFIDFPTTSSQQIFDSLTYSLFGMTGQNYADVISADLGLATPYQVATVVNSSFGVEGPSGRRGEDQIARIYNAVVTMTDATLIAPTSNDGNVDEPTGGGDVPAELTDLGRVYSPGSAHNTIAVGYIGREFNSVSSFSGGGPIQAQNYADTGLGDLYPITDMNFVNPFTPEDGDLESSAGVFREVRSGPDIVAPGELLRLPAETFVVTGSVFNTTADSEWTGVSFASAIVSGAAALMHELGEREGYSTSSVVTRAVLLNSANKSDENVGVGFDNEQMADQMDEDEPSITNIGLDEEAGAGSLDLVRLLSQYHRGTVITDYLPGIGLEGLTIFSDIPNQHDSLVYAISVPGTDPTVPFVTPSNSNPRSPRPLSLTCTESLGGSLYFDPATQETRDPWLDGRVQTQTANLYGPFNERMESLLDQASAKIMPMARRDDPDLNGDEPVIDDGGGDIPPASGDDVTGGGGGGGGGIRPFRSGWDHGMIGEGHIDLPIGPITPDSGIAVTLTWNRHESWQLPASAFAGNGNIVAFGGGSEGSVAALDPVQMNEFEYENLDLELWQVPTGPGGNRLVAASRGVWNNTECVFFDYVGGAPDGTSDGPFGNAPADHFIRIVFNQTLWDYGGFWFCNGPPQAQPKESIPAGDDGDFVNMARAQVEYGLAWFVEFNTDGYLDAQRAINRETGAVDISILGLTTNLDSQFEPLMGDVNADFRVNSNDAATLVSNFGSTNPNFDLNSDGIVDALDLQMVSLHLGEVAQPRKLTREEKQAEKQRRKDYKKMVKQRQKANKKANKIQKKGRR